MSSQIQAEARWRGALSEHKDFTLCSMGSHGRALSGEVTQFDLHF